jgi:hypothetical protein
METFDGLPMTGPAADATTAVLVSQGGSLPEPLLVTACW